MKVEVIETEDQGNTVTIRKSKYKVFASSMTFYEKEVEAFNEDEASDIAFHDNTAWDETGESDWQLERTEIVKE